MHAMHAIEQTTEEVTQVQAGAGGSTALNGATHPTQPTQPIEPPSLVPPTLPDMPSPGNRTFTGLTASTLGTGNVFIASSNTTILSAYTFRGGTGGCYLVAGTTSTVGQAYTGNFQQRPTLPRPVATSNGGSYQPRRELAGISVAHSLLTPADRRRVEQLACLKVRSVLFPGRTYIIPHRSGDMVMVQQQATETAIPVAIKRVCLQPAEGFLDVAEWMVLQKLLLLADEAAYLTKAIHWGIGSGQADNDRLKENDLRVLAARPQQAAASALADQPTDTVETVPNV